MNQHAKDFQDLHAVHTDRLRLVDSDDEKRLLLLTPSLKALSPRYVDHLFSPVCYTLFFLPDPTTLAFTNQNLHKANIPPHLLAPAPRASYLRAGTISASETPSPRKQHAFDDSHLNDIFSQWNTVETSTLKTPFTPIQPTPKRSRPASQEPNTGRILFYTQPSGEETSVPPHLPPTAPHISNYYSPLQPDAEDDNSPSNDDDSVTIIPGSTLEDMSTSSADSSYRPSMSDDDDTVDDVLTTADSEDLGNIYCHDGPHLEPTFLIENFETELSQQAYLHFQQIQELASEQAPTRQQEFTNLLATAVKTNQDPAVLAETLHSWTVPHP
jgi:hypothetical protein